MCPYGVIHCQDDVARKCDLCGGDPECVRFCPTDALRYESEDEWPAAQRQAYAAQMEELAQEVKS